MGIKDMLDRDTVDYLDNFKKEIKETVTNSIGAVKELEDLKIAHNEENIKRNTEMISDLYGKDDKQTINTNGVAVGLRKEMTDLKVELSTDRGIGKGKTVQQNKIDNQKKFMIATIGLLLTAIGVIIAIMPKG